jgi:hypothetical protein
VSLMDRCRPPVAWCGRCVRTGASA